MNMKTKSAIAMVALALMLAAPTVSAAAAFDQTNPGQNNLRIPVSVNDAAISSVLSFREFTVNQSTPAYVAMVVNTPHPYVGGIDYTVDVAACTNYTLGDVCTSVEAGVNHTNPTPEFTLLAVGTERLEFTLNFPDAANRTVGDVPLTFHIVLNSTDGGTNGTSGGVGLPTLAHNLVLCFHDPTVDSDCDHLPDAWEQEHFGGLDQTGNGDPDGDGYTNAEEYAAGSDPNNDASTPPEPVPGSGGNINDREFGNAVAGFLLFSVIVFLVMLFANTSEMTWLGIFGLLGVAVLAAFLLVFLLDSLVLEGSGWAWWSNLGASWQEWSVFGVVSSLTLLGAGISFGWMKQKEEVPVAIAAAVAVLLVGGVSFLLFGVFDVQLPF